MTSWLYGVSHRVARRARTTALRRQERKARVIATRQRVMATSIDRTPPAEASRPGTSAMVDAEIHRLPANQRLAVDLCLVQGLTHEAAARAWAGRWGRSRAGSRQAARPWCARRSWRGLTPSSMIALSRWEGSLITVSIVPPELVHRTLGVAAELVANPSSPRRGRSRRFGCDPGSRGFADDGTGSSPRRGPRADGCGRAGLGGFGMVGRASGAFREAAAKADPPQSDRVKLPPAKADGQRRDLYGDPLPAGAVLRMGTVRYRQESPIYHIAYTANGKYVVTDGEDSILKSLGCRRRPPDPSH